jgi:hypothetical protein
MIFIFTYRPGRGAIWEELRAAYGAGESPYPEAPWVAAQCRSLRLAQRRPEGIPVL